MKECSWPPCREEATHGVYCFQHNRVYGTKQEKPKQAIANVSEKEKERQKEYKKVRKEYMTEHPKCEFKGCNKVSTELHHRRGRIGSNLTDKTTFLALCHEHHRLIEDNPVMAKQEGYSESRLNTKQ